MHQKTISMKFPFLLLLLLLFSCDMNPPKANFLVTTQVAIKDGNINEVLNLFKETNPGLVRDQKDWIKAVFSVNESTNKVMVQAYWKSKEAYQNFSNSDDFLQTMKKFSPYFIEKPNIQINKILFEM